MNNKEAKQTQAQFLKTISFIEEGNNHIQYLTNHIKMGYYKSMISKNNACGELEYFKNILIRINKELQNN